MRRFRLLSARVFALLAALCLLVEQVGALEHGWSHALDPHAAHAAVDQSTGHADPADPDAGDYEESVAIALCDLCAHYAAVVHVPSAPEGASFVAAEACFAQPVIHASPLPARGAIHYTARAPPVSLT